MVETDINVASGFEFSDGDSENELTNEESSALADSLVSGYFEDYEDAKKNRPDDVEKVLERDKAEMFELVKDPNSIVAKENGKIVAVGQIVKVRCPDFQGKPIYMFGKMTVLPEHRKRKIFSHMTDLLVKKGEDLYPNAIFSVCTRNPVVKKEFASHGYEEVSLGEFGDMGQFPPTKERLKQDEELEKDGWGVMISEIEKNPSPVQTGKDLARGLIRRVLRR
jgi:hypothetical protein